MAAAGCGRTLSSRDGEVVAISISNVTGTVGQGLPLTIIGTELWKENLTGLVGFLTDPTYGTARRLIAGTDGDDLQTATKGPGGYNGQGWSEPGSGVPKTEGTTIGANGYIDDARKVVGAASAKFHNVVTHYDGVFGPQIGNSYNAWLAPFLTEFYMSWYWSFEGIDKYPTAHNKGCLE
jgi:hypothetical protein